MIASDQYQRYQDALLAGERQDCARIVQNLLASDTPLVEIYTELFQRSLYEVGKLWEGNRISVAVEHMATAITESLLVLLYPRVFAAPRKPNRAVISCGVNEYHQVGAKIVADTFEMHGWRTTFLGANTPADALLDTVQRERPNLVGLSLSIYFNLPGFLGLARELRKRHPGLILVAGGQAFRHGGHETLPPLGCHLVQDILDLPRRLPEWEKGHAA
jgi:methanogenic corrinoid protein MtbC1